MPKKKLFSLRFDNGERLDYTTLATTIIALKGMLANPEGTNVKSLRFKGWVLAEGKELTELLDD